MANMGLWYMVSLKIMDLFKKLGGVGIFHLSLSGAILAFDASFFSSSSSSIIRAQTVLGSNDYC